MRETYHHRHPLHVEQQRLGSLWASHTMAAILSLLREPLRRTNEGNDSAEQDLVPRDRSGISCREANPLYSNPHNWNYRPSRMREMRVLENPRLEKCGMSWRLRR